MKELKELLSEYSQKDKIIDSLSQSGSTIHLAGLSGSSKSLFASQIISQGTGSHIFILPDKESAAYLHNDLSAILDKEIFFFPSSYKRSIVYHQEDGENLILRTEILNKIKNQKSFVLVSYPEAIVEKVIDSENLEKNTLKLSVGEEISIDFIQEVMQEYDFQLVDFVYQPGQYSIRGSIVDIYSFSNEFPYRIDFFGDEVESIRTFDVETQLSKETKKKISIIPDIQLGQEKEFTGISFLDFVPEAVTYWTNNLKYCGDRLNEIYQKLIDNEADEYLKQIIRTDQLIDKLKNSRLIEFGSGTFFKTDQEFSFTTSKQPSFSKNFELLSQDILENSEKGYATYILSDNQKQLERLDDIFKELAPDLNYHSIEKTLHEGFIDHELKICCYTDHQIFGRYHKFKLRTGFTKKDAIAIKELNDLQPGDFVVHIDHGIGKFGGLERVDISGKAQEAIKLVYKDQDTVYVSIHALHKISKYRGKDAAPPKIYKLGSAAWQNLKQKTKKKVKDIAKELIQLYAKRKAEEGFAYSDDTYLQRELESSFIYEDTPDQLKATKAVKVDMESKVPMDRLVCGDVGFGKTEIAIRAAFKAVSDSKQVAILVPTTILALQHYHTFKNRLKDFPCNIDYISRLRTRKDQTQIIKKLKSGEIDIIIGTHRLVGKEMEFKDLGMLIIDEEQKFGVSVKEKLKQFKVNVDTLTLTATPIPRTLQFSLMGARDLSIINTPPPNRYPIVTELHTFNESIIKEAIEYEFQRNGQVFLINNRIQNIYEVEKMVNRICPEVRTVVGHGQMEGPKLEKIMLDFIEYEYDVLIATTIIESGLDIPNANTIIINDAQNFGLSDLHQLRGRVGRSNKKAFCYLMAPPLTSMTPEARKRLTAIEEFSELGSGFNIALQDLDIRGAGNMLGAEQSGFITDIGFETYQRILNEALLELKENEFKELYKEETELEEQKQIETQKFITDCSIDTDLELLFPESYINNIAERIRLYRKLDNIEEEEKLINFETELTDRFGELPDQSKELFNVVRLRWMAIMLGIEKIILKNNKLVLYFISDQESSYYQSPTFGKILNLVQTLPGKYVMKEKQNKLNMSIEGIKSISETLSTMQQFIN